MNHGIIYHNRYIDKNRAAVGESKPKGPLFSTKNQNSQTQTIKKELAKKAVREEYKKVVQEEYEQKEELNELSNKSDNVLLQTYSIFPFDLLSDKLTIDPTKVNIFNKTFFGTGQLDSLYIRYYRCRS